MKRLLVLGIALLAVFHMGPTLNPGSSGSDNLNYMYWDFDAGDTAGVYATGKRAFANASLDFDQTASLEIVLYACDARSGADADGDGDLSDEDGCESLSSLTADTTSNTVRARKRWYFIDINTAGTGTLTLKGSYEVSSGSGGGGVLGEGPLSEMLAADASPGDLWLMDDSDGVNDDCATGSGSGDILCMYTDSSTWSPAGLAGGGDGQGYALVADEGTARTARTTINFIGSNVACADDAGNSRTNCTFTPVSSLPFSGITTGTITGSVTLAIGSSAQLGALGTGQIIANSLANNTIDQTADFSSGLCGVNQYLVRGAVTWSCAARVTDTDNQSLFQTIAVSGQDDVVADGATDTLTLVAGSNITLTTSAAGDSVEIAASGSGSGATTSAGGVTYPDSATDDLAVGGTGIGNAAFFVDESTGSVYCLVPGCSYTAAPATADGDTQVFREGSNNGSNSLTVNAPDSMAANRSCTLDDDDTPYDGCTTLGDAVDISSETNLAAGRSLTLTGDSVAADAELYTRTETWSWLDGVLAAGDDLLVHTNQAITLVSLDCVVTGATTPTVTISVQECSSAGGSCVDSGLDAAISATTTLVTDDSPTDAAIDANDWWGLDLATLTTEGDVTSCTVEYTVND